MKNITVLYFIIPVFFITLNSCLFEEKEIFDDLASIRLQEQLKRNREILINADYGWIVDYFPLQTQEGYTILMKFNEDGSVWMAIKNRWTNNLFKDSLSLFSLIADQGPVLSFDTYNPCLHIFSQPEDIPETEEREIGRGMEGDYEFIILHALEELIHIKGKKRGITMEMRKFPAVGGKLKRIPDDRLRVTEAWKDYFLEIEDMNNYLFGRKDADLKLFIEDSAFALSKQETSILIVDTEDDLSILHNEKIPFMITEYGISLSDTFRLGDNRLKKFRLSEDRSALLNNNNENIWIKSEEAITYLSTHDVKYLAYKEDLGGIFYDTFLLMEKEFHSVFGGNRDLRNLGLMKEDDKLYFILQTWTNEATFVVPYEIVNGKLIIKEFDSYAL
ncbi:MAG: DUF4302 domain-containing protein, partial [Bacteroidales bacterium]|nr:DUF4302 domain-containing protein [Bacteroidales bacterium]